MNVFKPNVVITGATGFLGSSLAAKVLHIGGSVIAITRNDKNGQRTRQAILSAACGFGFTFSTEDMQRVNVIDSNLVEPTIPGLCDILFEQYTVWHCAAEMTYSASKLAQSLNTNLIGTQSLYQNFSRSDACQRFYYVSTAYTAGFDVDIAQESLHLQPLLINTYQMSKWAAEMSLSVAAQKSKLPVTLFRPSIICGHDKTGWDGGSKFGLYGVLGALKLATRLKNKAIEINAKPLSQPNFIPVNHVVNHALILQNNNHQREQIEIVHSVANESLKTSQLASIINTLWHVNIKLEKPNSRISQRINESVKPNLPFLNHVWFFSQKTLPQLADKQYEPYVMTEKSMIRLISYYHLPEKIQHGCFSNG